MKNLKRKLRPRRKPVVRRHERKADYRPHGYKPDWDVNALCPHCNKRLGETYCPVTPGEGWYHYDCLMAVFKSRH
jgi:hypothetical protein